MPNSTPGFHKRIIFKKDVMGRGSVSICESTQILETWSRPKTIRAVKTGVKLRRTGELLHGVMTTLAQLVFDIWSLFPTASTFFVWRFFD